MYMSSVASDIFIIKNPVLRDCHQKVILELNLNILLTLS
ncbi:hypothetical protein SLEP1_g35066 [Rubroshorea leprosula]|uniref:Ycf15 n=1 Tax=Rubroshorea leprosula TaxID=152421 RepID=A0AAV5KM15_9ROSI|nr:hypothetical protein SLEP1_g35066 [Rubroshorea leprosula]